MGALIFLGIVAEIVISYYIAKEFEKIAIMKGHNDKRYFWWSFLFGIAGWPMVIALPDRSSAEKQANDDEIPDI